MKATGSLAKSLTRVGSEISGVGGLVNSVFGIAGEVALGSELLRTEKILDGGGAPNLNGGPR